MAETCYPNKLLFLVIVVVSHFVSYIDGEQSLFLIGFCEGSAQVPKALSGKASRCKQGQHPKEKTESLFIHSSYAPGHFCLLCFTGQTKT